MPNLRRKARGRPQSLQRLCLRVENLGFFASSGRWCNPTPSFTLFAVVANLAPNSWRRPPAALTYARNGIPRCFNKVRAWLSFAAVVTIVTFMPFSLSTLA
jgi:hypothetical protein